MSSPDTRNRRERKRKARLSARGRDPRPASLIYKEETVRRLLLMVVDAAGGEVEIPASCAKRVSTLRMSLTAKILPEAEGGATLLRLEVQDPATAAEEPVG